MVPIKKTSKQTTQPPILFQTSLASTTQQISRPMPPLADKDILAHLISDHPPHKTHLMTTWQQIESLKLKPIFDLCHKGVHFQEPHSHTKALSQTHYKASMIDESHAL